MAGPTALPNALKLTAIPFNVPSTRREGALFVSRIVVQGNAKMTAQHLMSMTAKQETCCVRGEGQSTVKGVSM